MFIRCALLPDRSAVTAFHSYYLHWISNFDGSYFIVANRGSSLASTERCNKASTSSSLDYALLPWKLHRPSDQTNGSTSFFTKQSIAFNSSLTTALAQTTQFFSATSLWLGISPFASTAFCHTTAVFVLCLVFSAPSIHLYSYRNGSISFPWPVTSLLKAEPVSHPAASPQHTNETSPLYLISISIKVSDFTVNSTARAKVSSSRLTFPQFISFIKTSFTLPRNLKYVLTSKSYPSQRKSSPTQKQTPQYFCPPPPSFHLLRPITHMLLLHLELPRLKDVPQFRNSWMASFSAPLHYARPSPSI